MYLQKRNEKMCLSVEYLAQSMCSVNDSHLNSLPSTKYDSCKHLNSRDCKQIGNWINFWLHGFPREVTQEIPLGDSVLDTDDAKRCCDNHCSWCAALEIISWITKSRELEDLRLWGVKDRDQCLQLTKINSILHSQCIIIIILLLEQF